ncbi:hypothetical protein BMT55_11660 [Listeria newyorkensis]|uniref:P27 family phage terminase small subunit n=1 Tax=Listeria newyorkensis TaxID=1497681 RepID=A0ABX4XLE4_9LIST|nr:hypothetical protein BMT55_11660 [Listeria newyorkensis]
MRGVVVVPAVKRETIRMLIRRDLLEQLKASGIVGAQYKDLVDDYLALWDLKEELKKEIKTKGAMVVWRNGAQTGRKRSDAVVELPKVSKRMTDLLEVLGAIEPPAGAADDDMPDL